MGKRKEGEKTMVVLRSGRELSNSSSSVANKSDHISKSKGRYKYVSNREELISCYEQAFGHLGFKMMSNKNRPDPSMQLADKALNYFNQNSPQKYKLLELHSVTPTGFPRFMLYHINFSAKNTDVAAAPTEMFFTELTNSSTTGVFVRLCVSLGPINSLSGDKLNGCFFCNSYNNVWHPKGGGFVRGADEMYKTVQDICDINQNNAIPDHEKHLPRLEQLFLSREPKKEREYISEQVDDASLYATEALKFYNQARHINYELVKPGFVTRVILPTCLLFHVNFKAKDTDVATAPEEIFFAELTRTSGVFACELCVILGPADLISGDERGDITNGCYYCHEFNNVPHTIHGGFVRGGDSLYISEKELEETQPT